MTIRPTVEIEKDVTAATVPRLVIVSRRWITIGR